MAVDKTLTCRQCGASFTFTAGEQEFFQSKGFVNEPVRCPTCRAARRTGQNGGSGGAYSGTRSFGPEGADRREREMFTVTCDQCGKDAQVPFQPRGDKPVYCSDCFRTRQTESRGY